ncbi:hypothetical protein AOXY_G2750 [Acipenser oxyrinchus oxyrinchus]|uniref:Uncharacterized protein n=1 Tax=Acipenser oxyrinchus oxyrinchus TaxID=40147 RepID=A0AAD8LV10_ACIOX|nr:hypothetical protein AOXY_G2750 [Acipenser oxyrinchus oxyrinchus]
MTWISMIPVFLCLTFSMIMMDIQTQQDCVGSEKEIVINVSKLENCITVYFNNQADPVCHSCPTPSCRTGYKLFPDGKQIHFTIANVQYGNRGSYQFETEDGATTVKLDAIKCAEHFIPEVSTPQGVNNDPSSSAETHAGTTLSIVTAVLLAWSVIQNIEHWFQVGV